MKTEDFERLKSKIGDEFTAEYRVEKDSVMVLVTKKRLKVNLREINYGYEDGIDFFSFSFSMIGRHDKDLHEASKFLSEQLEKYLNNEIE